MSSEDVAGRAWRAYRSGDLRAGLRLIDTSLLDAPTDARALTLKARMLLGLDRPAEAASVAAEATASAPHRPEALALRAIALHRSEGGARAARAAEVAIERCLGPAERAELTFALDRYAEAGDAWVEAARGFGQAGDAGRLSEATGSAGVAFHLAGRHEEAVEHLRSATGAWVDLHGYDLHALLVDSLGELGHDDEAWAALPTAEDCRAESYGFDQLRRVMLRRWPERFPGLQGALGYLAGALADRPTVTDVQLREGRVVFGRGHGTRLSVSPFGPIGPANVVPWGAWQLRHEAADLRQTVATSRLLRWSDLAEAVVVSASDLRQAYEERSELLRTVEACGDAFAAEGGFTYHRVHGYTVELTHQRTRTDLDVRFAPTEVAGRLQAEVRVRLFPGDPDGEAEHGLGTLPLDPATIVSTVAHHLDAGQLANDVAARSRGSS